MAAPFCRASRDGEGGKGNLHEGGWGGVSENRLSWMVRSRCCFDGPCWDRWQNWCVEIFLPLPWNCGVEEWKSAVPHNLFNSFSRPYGCLLVDIKQTHFWGGKICPSFTGCLLKWMLNNQNSIKFPRGSIRMSQLKVSTDTCHRFAALFKYGRRASPDWLAPVHAKTVQIRIYASNCLSVW